MNKMRLSFCAALFAGLLTLNAPLEAAVESPVVGYTTKTMEGGKWYQFGVPFAPLDTENVPTLVSSFPGGFTDGDMAYVFEPASGAYLQPLTWCAGKDEDTTLTWRNRRLKETNPELPVGSAVFIKKATTSDVIVSGRVDATLSASFGNATQSAWAQIICPYPTSIALNDMNWTGLTAGEELYIFDTASGGYLQPLVYAAGKDADTEVKWRNRRLKESTLVIEPGQALFIHKVNAGIGSLSAQ